MVHEQYKELLAASALGSLDEQDQRALAAHIDTCSDCRKELEAWKETAAWLALDAAPAEPSPQFRSELLLKLTTEATATKSAKTGVAELPKRLGSTSTTAQRWGAIAAALALIALLVTLLAVWQQNRASRQELVRLVAQVEDTQKELDQQREAAQILLSPGARLTQLTGTPAAPSAHAVIAFDQTGRAVLLAKELPPPPAGKAYQLWFITGGSKLPGKVFSTNSTGDGGLKDQVPGKALDSAVFAITLEPETGASQPTGEIYLVSGS